MASISTDRKTGYRRVIFFVYIDEKKLRRQLRLGKTPLGEVKTIKGHVAHLENEQRTGKAVPAATAEWLTSIDSGLRDKLVAVGLVPASELTPGAAKSAPGLTTLATFLDAYIKSRDDVKGSTAIVYGHTRRCLVEYFGGDKLLRDILVTDAEEWRRWLSRKQELADNTVRRRCRIAQQFFKYAVGKRLISENPFRELKGLAVKANRSRDYFLSREDTKKVLDACPDAEWRLIFALARFGGLRTPSETLAMRWEDVDWTEGRMTVRAAKTEHHGEEHASRVVPIFPELRPYLEEMFDPEAVYVIPSYRDGAKNFRTRMERIVKRAKLKPWPKLFQNLRATRETELAEKFPLHVVCDWIGHSPTVAERHYLQVTDDHFAAALAADPKAAHKAAHTGAAKGGTERNGAPRKAKTAGKSDIPAVSCSTNVGDEGLEPPTSTL
jgi:integrase